MSVRFLSNKRAALCASHSLLGSPGSVIWLMNSGQGYPIISVFEPPCELISPVSRCTTFVLTFRVVRHTHSSRFQAKEVCTGTGQLWWMICLQPTAVAPATAVYLSSTTLAAPLLASSGKKLSTSSLKRFPLFTTQPTSDQGLAILDKLFPRSDHESWQLCGW